METKENRLEQLLFALFSIGVGCGVLLVRMSAIAGDGDYLWHTVLYDYMMEHKALPVQDTFSWLSVEKGYTEIAHSWLGSFILGWFVRTLTGLGCAPLFGGRVYCFFFYLVCVVLVWRTFFRGRVTWVYLVSCWVLAHIYTNPRIQCISALIFISMLYVLLRFGEENASPASLVALPVLTVLCANVHGGTVVLLLGIMLVYTVWQFLPAFEFGRLYHKPMEEKVRKWYLLGAVVASTLCVAINPYGIRLYTYFRHVGNSEFSHGFVTEWLPSDCTHTTFRILCLLLVLMLFMRERKNILHLGIVIGFMVLCFKYSRFAPYGVMLCVPLLKDYAADWDGSPIYRRFLDKYKSLVAFLVAIVGAVMIVFGYVEAASLVRNAETPSTWREMSDEAVAYLSEKSFKRPYCSYNVGGSLIYYGFQSFVDSRADLFVGDELMDCVNIGGLRKDDAELDELIEKYDFDAFIIGKTDRVGLCYFLELRGWVKDYKDDNYVVYVKEESR